VVTALTTRDMLGRMAVSRRAAIFKSGSSGLSPFQAQLAVLTSRLAPSSALAMWSAALGDSTHARVHPEGLEIVLEEAPRRDPVSAEALLAASYFRDPSDPSSDRNATGEEFLPAAIWTGFAGADVRTARPAFLRLMQRPFDVSRVIGITRLHDAATHFGCANVPPRSAFEGIGGRELSAEEAKHPFGYDTKRSRTPRTSTRQSGGSSMRRGRVGPRLESKRRDRRVTRRLRGA